MRHLILVISASFALTACQTQPLNLNSAFSPEPQRAPIVFGQSNGLESLAQSFALTANAEDAMAAEPPEHEERLDCGPPPKAGGDLKQRMGPPPSPREHDESEETEVHSPESEMTSEQDHPPCPPPRPPHPQQDQTESSDQRMPLLPLPGQDPTESANTTGPAHDQEECDEQKPPRPEQPDDEARPPRPPHEQSESDEVMPSRPPREQSDPAPRPPARSGGRGR